MEYFSIPFSTIKSGPETVAGCGGTIFQFHLVRLKVTDEGENIALNTVFQFHLVRLKGDNVKFAQPVMTGFQFHLVRLKVHVHAFKEGEMITFQFHLVRLKEEDLVRHVQELYFQFHLVRLKDKGGYKKRGTIKFSIPFSTIKRFVTPSAHFCEIFFNSI